MFFSRPLCAHDWEVNGKLTHSEFIISKLHLPKFVNKITPIGGMDTLRTNYRQAFLSMLMSDSGSKSCVLSADKVSLITFLLAF